jgi:hypothetical protein
VRLRLVNLLLAALLALSAARLSTALRAPQPQLPREPVAQTAAGAGAIPEVPAAGVPAAGATEGYDAIVARDLFSATRGVVPPEPPAVAKPAPKPPVQPKLTLTGVVIVDGEKAAYLQEGAQEAKPRKVREGESFAGGTVKLIRPDGITFLFAGSEVAVPLRTPKDGGAPPRPGEAATMPPQPEVAPRRPGQPVIPDAAAQLRRQQQGIPGVPRLIPAPEEEQIFEEEMPIDEEGDLVDEGELLDDSEFPSDDLEESQ